MTLPSGCIPHGSATPAESGLTVLKGIGKLSDVGNSRTSWTTIDWVEFQEVGKGYEQAQQPTIGPGSRAGTSEYWICWCAASPEPTSLAYCRVRYAGMYAG